MLSIVWRRLSAVSGVTEAENNIRAEINGTEKSMKQKTGYLNKSINLTSFQQDGQDKGEDIKDQEGMKKSITTDQRT